MERMCDRGLLQCSAREQTMTLTTSRLPSISFRRFTVLGIDRLSHLRLHKQGTGTVACTCMGWNTATQPHTYAFIRVGCHMGDLAPFIGNEGSQTRRVELAENEEKEDPAKCHDA